MSGASWQEGAGGGMLVDGRQDGGRVNNTQLIALSFLMKKKERNIATSSGRKMSQSARFAAGDQLRAFGPRSLMTATTRTLF